MAMQEDHLQQRLTCLNINNTNKDAIVRVSINEPVNSQGIESTYSTYIVEMNDHRINYIDRQVKDTIHGFITLSNLAWEIIDTPYFQRLKNMRQLGPTNSVYPAANHTRWEHSLGAYHLAKRMLDGLKKNTPMSNINKWLSGVKELDSYYSSTYGNHPHHKLDSYVCELVALAALLHDIGHGPFSHLFDDKAIKVLRKEHNRTRHNLEVHEYRSGWILEYIITNNSVLSSIILPEHIQFMKHIIEPPENCKGFIYEIVSNSRNGIDIDKIDYLRRDSTTLGMNVGFEWLRIIDDAIVIDNIICYSKKMAEDVLNLFTTRYKMHKTVYGHKTVVGIQHMINDIIVLMDPIIGIYESLENVDKFCLLTDSYILETVKFCYNQIDYLNYSQDYKDRIIKAHNILTKIENREHYKCIECVNSDSEINLTHTIFECDEDDILIHHGKIGYVSGTKPNPLDHVYFYDNKDPTNKIKSEISCLMSNKYQEHQCMIYIKDSANEELKDKITECVTNYKNSKLS